MNYGDLQIDKSSFVWLFYCFVFSRWEDFFTNFGHIGRYLGRYRVHRGESRFAVEGVETVV